MKTKKNLFLEYGEIWECNVDGATYSSSACLCVKQVATFAVCCYYCCCYFHVSFVFRSSLLLDTYSNNCGKPFAFISAISSYECVWDLFGKNILDAFKSDSRYLFIIEDNKER